LQARVQVRVQARVQVQVQVQVRVKASPLLAPVSRLHLKPVRPESHCALQLHSPLGQ
jgi:hypothetical protein